MGSESDEHGERFHQGIVEYKKLYPGRSELTILTDHLQSYNVIRAKRIVAKRKCLLM